MSAKDRIGMAANVAIVITCVLLVTIVVASRGPQLFRSAPPAPYQIGDVFSDVEADPKGGETLVLVFRTNCVPCRDSAPFHRALAKELAAKGTRVLAISTEPTDVTSDYLRQNDIPVTTVKSLAQLRVRSTPTLLWLDAKGVIKERWIGRLPAERENQVFRTLAIAVPIAVPSAD